MQVKATDRAFPGRVVYKLKVLLPGVEISGRDYNPSSWLCPPERGGVSPMTTIGMILFPQLTQLDLTGPYEVFARMPDSRICLAAASLDPVVSEHGLAILP